MIQVVKRNLVKLFANAFCLLFITFLTIFKPIICFFETKLTIISMDDYDNNYIINAFLPFGQRFIDCLDLSFPLREILWLKHLREREREREMNVDSYKDGVLPFAAMVTLEVGNVGMATLGKAAMTSGLSNFTYVVYYNALGTFILFLYYIFQRYRSIFFSQVFEFLIQHLISHVICPPKTVFTCLFAEAGDLLSLSPSCSNSSSLASLGSTCYLKLITLVDVYEFI